MRDAIRLAVILLQLPTVQLAWGVGSLVFGTGFGWAARRRGWPPARRWAAVAAGVSLAGVLALTWARWMVWHPDLRWRGCVAGSGLASADAEAVLNWMLLVPLAFFGMLALRRVSAVVTACVVIPLVIETGQSLGGLGTCQTADLVRNGAGGLAAAAVAALLLASARRRQTTDSSRPVSTS